MKNRITLFILGLFFVITTSAQEKEKIKAIKITKEKQIAIGTFNTIELYDDFAVTLTPGDVPMVTIETNVNLFDVIDIDVNSEVLSLNTTKEIRGKKTLNVTINYPSNLKKIVLHDKADLSSLSPLILTNIELETNDQSHIFMTVKADTIKTITNNKSKSELDLKASKINMEINGNSNFKGILSAENLNVDLYEKSKATLEGDVKQMRLRTDSNSMFVGKMLTADNATVLTEATSDAHVRTKYELNITAQDKSKLYIYGTPKLNITGFKDEAILFKKDE